MALNNINNTNESMAGLIVMLSDMYVEMARMKTYYTNMRKEAAKSFEDSRRYWQQTAGEESSRDAASCREQHAIVDEMIRELDILENELCEVDKSYAKRRETEYSVHTGEENSGYEESADYFLKLQKLYGEAVEIAKDCSLTVKTQAIQEIGMLFSNKRKQKYERLCYLIQETKHLRTLVFKELENERICKSANREAKKEEEIDRAANETAELIEAINLKEKEEADRIIHIINMQLDRALSAQDVDTLKEMKNLLGNYNILPKECCEHILIGELRADVSCIMAYQEAIDLMNINYAGCFKGTEMCIPAIYDIRNNFNICFDSHRNSSDSKNAIHSIMSAMLKNQPASRQTFVLSDPEGRSRGFDIYLDFVKHYPDIFGDRVLATKEQMKHAIKELSSYVDEVGQTKFVGYRDIFEYNRDVPDKQEPLRCLCLLNFPKYFDEDMLEDLYNIIKNGRTYGVQVLIDFDEHELSGCRGETQLYGISRIISECISLENRSGKWRYANGVSLVIDKAPLLSEVNNFMQEFAVQYKEVKNTSLPITKIVPEETWFLGDSSRRLEIPIGKNEDGLVQALVFGEGTSHHAMIIGSLGSGKSTLLHTIIMSAMMSFSPDEINLYLMDFKSGTEFKVYAGRNIPHIRLLALDAMQEFGQSILDELWDEMNRRSEMFHELIAQGMDIKDITDYRKMTGKKLPRILVVADEFQMLVSEEHNRKIANYCGGRLADFISLSRVYGIHFILATQTISRLNSGFAIRKSTINEMYVRIGLKCTENECNDLFGNKNGRAAFGKMGTEKGSAVYAGDYVQGLPVAFKVAFCDTDMQAALLNEIEERYSLMEMSEKTKVFVGNAVPKLSECGEFVSSYSLSEKALPVYIGEPIKIAPPTTINLNRTKRSNLLIVGADQEMADGIVGLYMLNVVKEAALKDIRKTKVYLLDGLTIIGEMQGEVIHRITSSYPSYMRIAKDNYDVIRVVDELYSEYLDRKEKRASFEVNAGSVITMVIHNMQWIETIGLMLANKSVKQFINASDDAKKEKKESNDTVSILARMDSFIMDVKESPKRDTSNISHGRKLLELIESGYTCGIHFALSVPDYISIKEYMYGPVSRFSNRILFSMSNDDAGRLINDAKTEQLKNNMVIYYDGINPAYQIKPYSGISEYINQYGRRN